MDTINQKQFLEAIHLEPVVDRFAYEKKFQ